MKVIIGVDLGTTSTKAVVYNLQGQVQAHATVSYPLFQETLDMAEEDPDEIFSAVVTVLTWVMRQVKISNAELQGVAFSAAMHSLILLDAAKQPLTRAITWADNRAAKYTQQLKQNGLGQTLYQKTGTPIHPMTPLSKLIWLRHEKPELFHKAHYFIGIKDYILEKLFGQLVMDHSLASATGLFNIFNLDWDPKALATAHINAQQLPKLVPTTYQLHGLNPAYAKVTGIAPDVPFIIGASDGVLSNLGVDAIDPGVLAVTIGTSGAVRTVVDHPVTDPQGRLFCYALTPGKWVVGGPVNNGGIVFRWVRDQLFAPEKLTAQQMQVDTYDILTTIAGKIPAGANGLLFHPYLGGERAPIWNANARGSFFGLTRQHTRAHMVRAALEGIVYNLYLVMLQIKKMSDEPKAIQATGGFVRSELWRQMLADIFEQKVTIPQSFESSCLGAAVIGMLSLKLTTDLNIVKKMVGKTNVHQPNPANFTIYRELLPIWIRVGQSLAGEYQNIADFQRKYASQATQQAPK